jgi:hypothetical protein
VEAIGLLVDPEATPFWEVTAMILFPMVAMITLSVEAKDMIGFQASTAITVSMKMSAARTIHHLMPQ